MGVGGGARARESTLSAHPTSRAVIIIQTKTDWSKILCLLAQTDCNALSSSQLRGTSGGRCSFSPPRTNVIQVAAQLSRTVGFQESAAPKMSANH